MASVNKYQEIVDLLLSLTLDFDNTELPIENPDGDMGEVMVGFRYLRDMIAEERRELIKAEDKIQRLNKSLESEIRIKTLELNEKILALQNARDYESKLRRALTNLTQDLQEEHEKMLLANKRIERASKRLNDKNEELEQFAYAASHDLQGPLKNIEGIVGMLQRNEEGNLGDIELTYLEHVATSTSRMSTLIRGLLEYSRITSEQLELNEEVDLNEVLKESKASYLLEIENGTVIFQSDQLPIVRGNGQKLQSAFSNLISNGIKYCERETTPNIAIQVEEDQGQWLVHFKDNGIGISEEHFKNIFTIYRRLHREDKFQGTGVGLALCKKVVSQHGGEIRVSSTLGEGSVFTVVLPKSGVLD